MKQKLIVVLFVLAFCISCEGKRGESIVGPSGFAGANGSDGTIGSNGSPGATGPEGPTGPDGPGEPGTNLTIECQKPAKQHLKLCQDLSTF